MKNSASCKRVAGNKCPEHLVSIKFTVSLFNIMSEVIMAGNALFRELRAVRFKC